MTTPRDRIRNLVSAGKISAAEGERLHAALTPPSAARSPWFWLLNPFDRFGGGRAVAAGVAVSAISVGLERLGVHFDGFLDVHLASNADRVPVAFGSSMLHQAAGWLVPSLVFWAYARVASGHVRLVDFVGVVGLARAVLVLVALLGVALDPEVPSGAAPHFTPALVVLILGTLPLLGWFVTLLYQGFKNASGLAGGKLVGGFIGVLFVSEVLSALVLHLPH
jgi:hypothetical protein